MTPWDDDTGDAGNRPGNLLAAAGVAFEWALLASFQADLKLFRRINELVRLRLENARLQAVNAALQSQLRGEKPDALADQNRDGVPDILEKAFHQLPDPVIIAPRRPIPVEQIISYTLKGHKEVYEMGYNDARRAWREAGRAVEGEAASV